jgi:hypothetical protein
MIDNLLQKMLQKLGVKEFSELSESEKQTYREWDKILSTRKLTDDDVKLFLDTEQEETIQKLTTQKYKEREDIFLKMKLEFIRKIKSFLMTPELEKKIVEENINKL